LKKTLPFFRFILYSNIFITACAWLMVRQVYDLLLKAPVNTDYAGFVIFSTLCSYSFHWYLTTGSVLPSKRMDWLKKNRWLHVVLFFAGLAGAVFFFYRLTGYWLWLLGAVIPTFLYSAPKIPHPLFRVLRKVAYGKTFFLSFVWTYVTAVLPLVLSGKGWEPVFTVFILGRFFLVYAICLVFDYRDREDDRHDGVISIITNMPEKQIRLLFYTTILLFIISTVSLHNYEFPFITVLWLLIPGIITALLFPLARKNFSDWLYYFILDGLMAFSALLTLVARI